MDSIRLDGKVALITGAGGSLGKAYAIELASLGASIFVNDLGCDGKGEGQDKTAADSVAADIKATGGKAAPNYLSVAEGDKIVAAAMETFGRLDIVIHSAGILRDVSFSKMTETDWDKIMECHFIGTYKITKAAWPIMIQQNFGRIVFVTSAAGLYGNYGQANYSSAKMALVGLGQTLALEGEKKNIKVNMIAPVAGSRLVRTVLPPEICDQIKPEYVSPLVAYLCSDGCPVNGAIYEVGAGVLSRVQWIRSQGTAFPLREGFTLEKIIANWEAVNNTREGRITTSFAQSTQWTMNNLKTLT